MHLNGRTSTLMDVRAKIPEILVLEVEPVEPFERDKKKRGR